MEIYEGNKCVRANVLGLAFASSAPSAVRRARGVLVVLDRGDRIELTFGTADHGVLRELVKAGEWAKERLEE